jgi:hypothetical protein
MSETACAIIGSATAFFSRSGMDMLLRYCEFALGKAECTGAFRKVFFPAAIVVEFVGEPAKGDVFGVGLHRFGVTENIQQLPVKDSFHLLLILTVYEMG